MPRVSSHVLAVVVLIVTSALVLLAAPLTPDATRSQRLHWIVRVTPEQAQQYERQLAASLVGRTPFALGLESRNAAIRTAAALRATTLPRELEAMRHVSSLVRVTRRVSPLAANTQSSDTPLSSEHLFALELVAPLSAARLWRERIERWLDAKREVVWFAYDQRQRRQLRDTPQPSSSTLPSDPLFASQWHLRNTGQRGGKAGVDVNILDAWADGFTGNGSVIAIVEEPFQASHPDLKANYVLAASVLLTPNLDIDAHATRSAGVAAAARNSVCGVGAAYNAKLASIGLPVDDQDLLDSIEAQALLHKIDYNQILSNSWGPVDNGYTLEGPGTLATEAFAHATLVGRGGLGTIYVWAAGNGAHVNDNCNYDGYASSPYTIAVGAIDNYGRHSFYSEPCAALLVVAPSDGGSAGVSTTDAVIQGSSECTSEFGGTSSAAPLVAGVVALMLEANARLSWRDVQLILARSAVMINADDGDWVFNGGGLHHSHRYGFGLVNAHAAVRLAQNWEPLGAAKELEFADANVNLEIAADAVAVSRSIHLPINSTVESVQVRFTAEHEHCSDLRITLTSPAGITSVLAEAHGNVHQVKVDISGIANAEPTSFIGVRAIFGPQFPASGVVGFVVPTRPSNGCSELSNANDVAGGIAIIRQGLCSFDTKVKNAQLAGAIAVIVVAEGTSDLPPMMFPTLPEYDCQIPSVLVRGVNGAPVMYAASNAPRQVVANITADYSRRTPIDNVYDEWTFTSVRHWGEFAQGNWTLTVENANPNRDYTAGTWRHWSLRVRVLADGLPDDKLPYPLWLIPVVLLGVALLCAVLTLIVHRVLSIFQSSERRVESLSDEPDFELAAFEAAVSEQEAHDLEAPLADRQSSAAPSRLSGESSTDDEDGDDGL